MIVGIMLGVAVVVAIDLANASAARAFDLSTEAVTGKTTHQIIGGPAGIDETLYIQIRRSGIVQYAAPVIQQYISSPELGDYNFELLGLDPFAEAPFRDYFIQEDEDNLAGSSQDRLVNLLTHPGAILISQQVADQFGLGIGSKITINLGGQELNAEIVDLLDLPNPLSQRAMQNLIITDIASAQEFTGRYGVLDRIDLILPQGTIGEGKEEEFKALLPEGIRIIPVTAREGTVDQMTNAFRINLTALSLLALLVGLFLIYNTMTFSVVQRRSMFGTMRSLGVTRKEVFWLVTLEALMIGFIGAGLGLFLGVLMGQGAVKLVTQTVNDLFFVVSVRGVQIPVESLIKGIVLGVLATVLSAAPPAWEAASVQPRVALSRSGLERKAIQVVFLAAIAGLCLLVVGVFILILPTKNLVVSFIGTLAVTVGFAGLAPIATVTLMKILLPILSRIFGILGRMAPRDVTSSLSRTGIAIAALMVAVSVTIGVSLMVSSFRYTVILWLEQTLQGDIYISAPGQTTTQTSTPIDPQILSILTGRPEIYQVSTLRAGTVDSPLGLIQIAATSNPDVGSERSYQSLYLMEDALASALSSGYVLLSEPLVNRLELTEDTKEISLYTAIGEQRFPIAGIYYDYSSPQGTLLMSQQVYREYFLDNTVTAVALYLMPEITPDEFTLTLQDELASIQALNIRPNRLLRGEVLDVFDRTFAITSALQLLATTVAFVGVLSALMSLELERSREFGILRAIGLTVRQIWGLILAETSLLGGSAGVLAMPTGFVLAVILIFIINKRSFGWTLQMQLTAGPFILAFVVAISAAVLAGIYPAWRISRTRETDAIRME